MAERNDKVMEMVKQELERDPEVSLDVLVQKAKEIDPAVGELTPRQFHARYPLQVKRSRNAGTRKSTRGGRKRATRGAAAAAPAPATPTRRRGGATAEGQGVDRDAIRSVFLEFAGDFAKAESRQEIVGVLRSVDAYVDRVQKLVSRR